VVGREGGSRTGGDEGGEGIFANLLSGESFEDLRARYAEDQSI